MTGASRKSNVVSLDDHRPHNASYVACVGCGHDWPCIHPPEVETFECPECGAMAGAVVDTRDTAFFKRFMDAARDSADTQRRTMVLLNAQRMIDEGVFDDDT